MRGLQDCDEEQRLLIHLGKLNPNRSRALTLGPPIANIMSKRRSQERERF